MPRELEAREEASVEPILWWVKWVKLFGKRLDGCVQFESLQVRQNVITVDSFSCRDTHPLIFAAIIGQIICFDMSRVSSKLGTGAKAMLHMNHAKALLATAYMRSGHHRTTD